MFNEPFNMLARSRTYTDDSTEILKWIARIFQTVLDTLEIRLLLVRFAKMCSRRPVAVRSPQAIQERTLRLRIPLAQTRFA